MGINPIVFARTVNEQFLRYHTRGPGRFCGVKIDYSSRCRVLTASQTCCMPSSPETALR